MPGEESLRRDARGGCTGEEELHGTVPEKDTLTLVVQIYIPYIQEEITQILKKSKKILFTSDPEPYQMNKETPRSYL